MDGMEEMGIMTTNFAWEIPENIKQSATGASSWLNTSIASDLTNKANQTKNDGSKGGSSWLSSLSGSASGPIKEEHPQSVTAAPAADKNPTSTSTSNRDFWNLVFLAALLSRASGTPSPSPTPTAANTIFNWLQPSPSPTPTPASKSELSWLFLAPPLAASSTPSSKLFWRRHLEADSRPGNQRSPRGPSQGIGGLLGSIFGGGQPSNPWGAPQPTQPSSGGYFGNFFGGSSSGPRPSPIPSPSPSSGGLGGFLGGLFGGGNNQPQRPSPSPSPTRPPNNGSPFGPQNADRDGEYSPLKIDFFTSMGFTPCELTQSY
jgi:hypothetical protein